MLRAPFVHLHLHTQYSLLDGACRIADILKTAQDCGMDSLAITDHGNMFGAIEFYMEAQKAGIKPIIGAEVYVAPESRLTKSSSGIEDASYHLILLARDETGYRNLMKLVSAGYLEGFYYRPRIDKEILSTHAEGLIGLSACLKGEVPSLIRQQRFNDALKAADTYASILGRENFYLEVQANSIPEQQTVNEGLFKLARELNLKLVATNDVHYLKKKNATDHEVLLCIQTQTTMEDPNRMRFQTDDFYFKSPQEMKEFFRDCPEAITNTVEVAERCNLELDFKKVHLPKYTPPGGVDKEVFLRSLCDQGLLTRYGTAAVSEQISQRLEYEIGMIKKMHYISYFLIVWDFIHYAKSKDIPVGPGRGSAAGSLVSYLLGITDIDPLEYGLLFERFLNPERVGLPDIDIDFCYERRQEVIDYVTGKYGRENVAQIITFGTMQAKAVVRDVGRCLGMEYAEVDRIAKMIPQDLGVTLADALNEPEFRRLYDGDAQVKKLVDAARGLEGLNRHASVHAAGVVIADKPLDNYMPLFKTGDGQVTSGYSMGILEKIGMLKMDFLGLRTLTVIDEAIKLIRRTRGVEVDFSRMRMDDTVTYALFASAQTSGVFQLESSGMRDLLRKLEPTRFEDIIALLALYRPGPIGSGMLDDFIKRKHGRVPIRYDHKKLEPVLKETYGIIVYQEQNMQIASLLANYTMAEADLLRRAMAKKKPEEMEKHRAKFMHGCVKNGISEHLAKKIFELIEYFSGYGFNKSHSTAYAVISYRTAYLKANYPVEFMTALLTSERDNTDKIIEYVNEAGRMGIKVLPPDINNSDVLFTVEGENKIRFGMLAVKNVGAGAAASIVEQRKAGPYGSLEDLCQRVDLRLANKKVLESLIKCGALDSFGMARARMVAALEPLLEAGARQQRDRAKGQYSFFDGDLGGAAFRKAAFTAPEVHEWPESQVLSFEKEMLGFYVSGHPLARYARQLKRFASTSTATFSKHQDDDEIKIVGLINKVKNAVTRAKQEKMCILKLEDLDGSVEVLVFPRAYQAVSRYLQPGTVVLIKGKLQLKEETPKIIANDVLPFENVYRLIQGLNIDLSGIQPNLFETLKEVLAVSHGTVPIYLHVKGKNNNRVQLVVGENYYVSPSDQLIRDIEGLLGEERLSLVL